jgi:hypothetical protein
VPSEDGSPCLDLTPSGERGCSAIVAAQERSHAYQARQETFNPHYTKAREDQILSNARRNTGTLRTGANLVVGGGRLGRASRPFHCSVLASRLGIVGRTLSSAADAAGLGGIAGFNEGNPFETARLSVKARAVTFQMLGKNRHIPGSVVEIDFWRGSELPEFGA